MARRKPKPKPQLNLDGSWIEQLDEWIKTLPRPLPFSIDALDRVRCNLTVPLTGKPGLSPRCDQITVRQVITMTRDEILSLEGVGKKTMEVIDAFLTTHNITELGPANAKPPPDLGFPPPGVDPLMATGHA